VAKLNFLVSLTTDDNDYQQEQATAAEETAARLGVGVQIVYADNDTIKQGAPILSAIQAPEAVRPNAIIFEPVDSTALPQAARAAVGNTIGWVVLNREADYIRELRRTGPLFSQLARTTWRSGGFRASNLPRYFRWAAPSSTSKGLPTTQLLGNEPWECRKPSPPTSTSSR